MRGNNNVLNRLFTKQILDSLIVNQNYDILETIVTRYLSEELVVKNIDAISNAYAYMEKNYRNEYVYINTLLNKVLLGRHSLRTTTALTQLPVENSKADFILLNGKAVLYEIKTELDSFERLPYQLEDYYKAFPYVNVVTSEHNYSKLYKMLKGTPTGIYILSSKNTLQEKKKAIDCKQNINHKTLFKILRKQEYENIILDFYQKLPNSTPVFYYDECYKVFEKIPIDNVYTLFLKELKQRNKILNTEQFLNIPYALKSLIYFSNVACKNYSRIFEFLNSNFKENAKCITHM